MSTWMYYLQICNPTNLWAIGSVRLHHVGLVLFSMWSLEHGSVSWPGSIELLLSDWLARSTAIGIMIVRSWMKRRNSCAFISVSARDVGVTTHHLGGQQLECVSRVQDPKVLEMDRQRKISWSATVGSSNSRSVDTGLNELHRITGKCLQVVFQFSYCLVCII